MGTQMKTIFDFIWAQGWCATQRRVRQVAVTNALFRWPSPAEVGMEEMRVATAALGMTLVAKATTCT